MEAQSRQDGRDVEEISLEETNKIRISLGLKPLDPRPSRQEDKSKDESISLEETNRIRQSLGLKPLEAPTKGATSTEDEEARAVRNLRELRDAEASHKRQTEIEERLRKARERVERNRQLKGRTLADEEGADEDLRSWVRRQRTGAASISDGKSPSAAASVKEDSTAYSSRDLAGMRVAHGVADIQAGGDDVVLTLEDRDILDEGDDELVNEQMAREERRKRAREQNKKRQPYQAYMEDDGEMVDRGDTLLSQYNEDIHGETKPEGFTIDVEGSVQETEAEATRRQALEMQAQTQKRVNLLETMDVVDDNDNSDYRHPVKIRKSGKIRRAEKRKRAHADDEGVSFSSQNDGEEIKLTERRRRNLGEDSGNVSYVDDEDLSLALARRRRQAQARKAAAAAAMQPNELAIMLKAAEDGDKDNDEEEDTGLVVVNEVSEFVSNIRPEAVDLDNRPAAGAARAGPVTAGEPTEGGVKNEPESDVEMPDNDDTADGAVHNALTSEMVSSSTTGLEEERLVSGGMGAALALLREKGVMEHANEDAQAVAERDMKRQEWLMETRRIQAMIEQERRQSKEADRSSGKLDRMTHREQEAYNKKENEKWERRLLQELNTRYRDYRPEVNIRYYDEMGNELNTKEAYKQMAHQFHGKSSGKMKTEKRLKKLEDQQKAASQPIF